MNDSGVVSRWRSWAPYLLSTLRIITAFLFMQVGTAKLFAFPGAVMPGGGTAPVASLAGIAGFLEVAGGLLMLVGLFTRPAAFILSGEMAFAYFIGHAPQGFWPVLNGGALAAVYCFLFLYFSAAGAGPWSIDAGLFPEAGAGEAPRSAGPGARDVPLRTAGTAREAPPRTAPVPRADVTGPRDAGAGRPRIP